MKTRSLKLVKVILRLIFQNISCILKMRTSSTRYAEGTGLRCSSTVALIVPFFLLFVSMVTQKTIRATVPQIRDHRATLFDCHICYVDNWCVFIKWRKNVVTFYLSFKDYTCNHWWSNRSHWHSECVAEQYRMRNFYI